MAKKEERFEQVYTQGALYSMEIWVDRETGVNYLAYSIAGGGTSLTPLLDREGKPLVSTVSTNPEL